MPFGDSTNIPQEFLTHVNKESVLYWSSPNLKIPLCKSLCYQNIGPVHCPPCLLLSCPIATVNAVSNARNNEITSVILTTTSLVLLKSGLCTFVKTVPLDYVYSFGVGHRFGSLNSLDNYCNNIDITSILIHYGETNESILQNPRAPRYYLYIYCHENIAEFCLLFSETRERFIQNKVMMLRAAGSTHQMTSMPQQTQQPTFPLQQQMGHHQFQPMMIQQTQPIQVAPIGYGNNTTMQFGQPQYPQPMSTAAIMPIGQSNLSSTQIGAGQSNTRPVIAYAQPMNVITSEDYSSKL